MNIMTRKFLEFHDGDEQVALSYAAEEGYIHIIRELINVPAEDTKIDKQALIMACEGAAENGHLEIVKYLVDQGADIHENPEYLIRLSAVNGHLEIVKYLTKKGCRLLDDDSETLVWATDNGCSEVVRYLTKIKED